MPRAQVAQARAILDRMAAVRAGAGAPALALLAGDFNSAPGSAVVRFVGAGALDCAAEDRRGLSGQLECQARGWRAGLVARPRFTRTPAVLSHTWSLTGASRTAFVYLAACFCTPCNES